MSGDPDADTRLDQIDDAGYLAHASADRLGRVQLGAASIGFTTLDRIDLDVLGELLRDAHTRTPPDPD